MVPKICTGSFSDSRESFIVNRDKVATALNHNLTQINEKHRLSKGLGHHMSPEQHQSALVFIQHVSETLPEHLMPFFQKIFTHLSNSNFPLALNCVKIWLL